MSLTIRSKLVFVGILAIAALAGSNYMSYRNIQSLGQFNGIASVTVANGNIVQRMASHRQELAEGLYVALLHRAGGAFQQEDIDAMKGYGEKLNAMTSRFLGRQISYTDKEAEKTAAALAQEITAIATVQVPEMAANGASQADIDGAVATFKEKVAALVQAHTTLRDQLQEEGGKNGDAVISLIDQTEQQLMAVVGTAAGVLAVLVALVIISIARPLKRMVSDIERLAVGDYSQELGGINRSDEIGHVVKALMALQEFTAKKAREEAEAEMQRKAKADAEKKQALHQMADNFEHSVKAVVQQVASSATQMQSGAQNLTKIAEDTKSRSNVVVAASAQAAQTSAQVAAAAEELTASIREISAQTQKSNKVASDASHKAEYAKSVIDRLAEKSSRVGQIIEVITSIAGQINLLALNATIESARAGEAGKGFAVVASEVKNLAGQVGKATDEITQQINEIQEATQTSVASVMDILAIIGQVSTSTSTVAAAVEEQSAVTDEIAHNVNKTSAGTQEISHNMTSVQKGAGETGDTAWEVLESAKTLNQQSNELKTKVDEFLSTIRAA